MKEKAQSSSGKDKGSSFDDSATNRQEINESYREAEFNELLLIQEEEGSKYLDPNSMQPE